MKGIDRNMIDLKKAHDEFDNYLQNFDCENEKIKLKMIHTDGVIKCASEIAHRMKLSQEDCQLAELIALLHDIGRFEQVKLYDSFEPTMMDHASFGVDLLFGERQMIRQFVTEECWDEIIRSAIARHSDFAVGEFDDPRQKLHACLIRDADKLDNCRVKLEDSMEVLLNMDAKAVGAQPITEKVWQSCLDRKSILSADRETKMDYWVSYIAYFFDISFPETFSLIKEEQYVQRIIARVPYSNPDTAEKMEQLEEMILEYIDERME